jgi:pimeloyl-ACP methyl ester carboxylesterase
MKEIYCISGLGADERIFSRLVIPGARLVHLKWLTPLENESISAYAARMLASCNSDRPLLMGVSFGGMMAVEMAKLAPAARVILISSVKSRHELPQWMKWSGRLGLYKLLPSKPPAWVRLFGNNFLQPETQEEIQLCKEFREQVDPVYLHWAVGQIVTWRNESEPADWVHFHGDKDRVFPSGKVHATNLIRGGGHFMVMNRARELSELLTAVL